MEHQKTVLDKALNNNEEISNQLLPGAMIQFTSIVNTGSSQNEYGVGDMDISLHRAGQKYPWVDLMRINFSNPTYEKYLDAETSPPNSKGRDAFSDINRRLSVKQANFIASKIMKMLNKEFPDGIIPPDDEITL